MKRSIAATCLYLLFALDAAAAAPPPVDAPKVFWNLRYTARVLPSEKAVKVQIEILDGAEHLSELSFRIDSERHRDFRGSGDFDVEDGRLIWKTPPGGGSLHYTFLIDSLRDDRSYDARAASKWAIFRGDDMVPPARATFADGSESRAQLRLQLPDGWSALTPYPKARNGHFDINHSERKFDRPTGWMLVGADLALLREKISGVRFAIGSPASHDVRHRDMLALLRWTLPSIDELLKPLPPRITVVSADDPMWRGGLSASNSIFLHADRPLITPDGTSPLLHEILHVLTGLRSGGGGDWIVEGLVDFYSLELLRRSGTVSQSRYEKALVRIEKRGRRAPRLGVESATGAVTARAVSIFRALDLRIRESTDGARSLDDVLRILQRRHRSVTNENLVQVSGQVAGQPLDDFFRKHLSDRP